MTYQVKPLRCDPARLKGLSERLIVSHYENNYGGAVKRLNAITDELRQLDYGAAPVFRINGLKREELVAMNSMVLHELYFDGLGAADRPAQVSAALAQAFGSIEAWHTQFAAMGKAQGGGSGWVVLCYSLRNGTLMNQWAADHTTNLAGGVPILALDMYEHSYHIDYGAKAAAYVDAFMQNINWQNVAAQHQRALAGKGS